MAHIRAGVDDNISVDRQREDQVAEARRDVAVAQPVGCVLFEEEDRDEQDADEGEQRDAEVRGEDLGGVGSKTTASAPSAACKKRKMTIIGARIWISRRRRQ